VEKRKQFAERRVAEIMHRGVITCKPHALLKEVVRIITDSDVHALVVVDDNGDVAGIVSHMDLLRLYGRNLLNYRAEDVMTRAVVTIAPTSTVEDAVALMLEKDIHRLLVTEQSLEGERPIGVVSTSDVIRDMREQPWFW
jgi:CBS domain-containing protein